VAGTVTITNPGELRVYASAEAVADAAAELFVELCEQSVRERGRFVVALSGGSTPKRTYELLASSRFSRRVDWRRVELFWGDERYVPKDDPNSNFRMTSEALLSHIAIPSQNVHAVPTEITPAEAAATAYEAELRRAFGDARSIPQFDLVYLGLGTNGHTASLFPHSPTLKEESRLFVADFVAEVNTWRLTMTAPVLNRGRVVAFLVAGREKADVMRQVLTGVRDPERLPAQLIAPEGKLLWIADEAAASMLPHGQSVSKAGRERAS
jgi:6-phosphogluconolactonase